VSEERLDQQRAGRRRGERLGEPISNRAKRRREGAEEGSETASLPPEASGESMAESEREEKRRESGGGELLPWEGEERLERLLDRGEGGSAKRRREHDRQSEERERRRSQAREWQGGARERGARLGLSQIFTKRSGRGGWLENENHSQKGQGGGRGR